MEKAAVLNSKKKKKNKVYNDLNYNAQHYYCDSICRQKEIEFKFNGWKMFSVKKDKGGKFFAEKIPK